LHPFDALFPPDAGVRPLARLFSSRRGGVRAAVGESVVAADAVVRGTVGRGEGSFVRSNVVRSDYAGSASCTACHADLVARWRRSAMHRMTRDPVLEDIRAPFAAGRTLTFKGDAVRLTTRGGRPLMELRTRTGEQHTYAVTRVIGGRHREDFAGLEIASAADEGRGDFAPVGDRRHELILPASFVYDGDELRPKGYSVMVGERPGLRAGGVWNQTCIFCHNTVPWLDTALGTIAGPRAPGYQGALVDKTLPSSLRWQVDVRDADAFRAAVANEAAFVARERPTGAATADESTRGWPEDPASVARRGAFTVRDGFGAAHFVEEGIGCESCHGGCREHVDDPRVRPSFAPRAPFLQYAPASGPPPPSAPVWQNRACARCHQVLFSRYPYTWEGGSRHGGDAGGSSITSGEARDLLLSRCGRALTCATCHDPHGTDDPVRLRELATPAGNAVCVKCHAALGEPAALKAHAHHDPRGAGGACIACHMPLKNTGLGYELTRYHRLGSPLEPARVERDRPLECALCHPDATVRRLLEDVERLWGKRYDRAALTRLYGDLDRNALEATVATGRAHEQIAAAATLGQARIASAAPVVAHFVAVSAFPLGRRHGLRALRELLQKPCDVDVDLPFEELSAALARCGPGLGVGGRREAASGARSPESDRDDD
ncbi:MAG TPA: cytochrome c3 family protein, partial [Polyangia bacterium]